MDANLLKIKAQILEEDGRIVIRKACPKHGSFEDVLADDPAFFFRMESLFFGRDFNNAQNADVHDHEVSTIKFGRGAVLIVNLTEDSSATCYSRCTRKVGLNKEPTLADIRAILDHAVSFKPRRQIIILFTGNEPTTSRHYLEAVAYANRLGFYRVLSETNGLRFAGDIDFCRAAKEAGQHGVYLRFDSLKDKSNDVSLHAINNLASVGIKVTLVITVANKINNKDIGKTVEFASKNIAKVQTIVFQPICFNGQNEEISDDLRQTQRYTLSHLAQDLEEQLWGRLRPQRDWYPLSSYSAFTSVMDMLQGAETLPGAGRPAIVI